MNFGGTYRHNIDEKNRMRIPAKFREKLSDGYCLTCGTDGCLFVFSERYFEEVFAPMLERLPMTDPAARKIVRLFMASKYDVEEDKQGRFVLPENLLKFAGIDKNLVIIGTGPRIEIWSESAYERYSTLEDFDTVFSELSKYGLSSMEG